MSNTCSDINIAQDFSHYLLLESEFVTDSDALPANMCRHYLVTHVWPQSGPPLRQSPLSELMSFSWDHSVSN